jgi:hypothetical protein
MHDGKPEVFKMADIYVIIKCTLIQRATSGPRVFWGM